MPFVNSGDLVMVTESCTVPTEQSKEWVPCLLVPQGTVGVVVQYCGDGTHSLITGLGVIQVPTRNLKRLGMTLPDRMQE